MNAYESAEVASTDVAPRTERAPTECTTVLPLWGDVYSVTTESGAEYRVDGRDGRCTRPDHNHRDVECNHIRRVAFATGDVPIPGDVDGVDDLLGEHVDGEPQVVAADGGIIEAGDDGEILDESDDDRPDDCDCGDWNNGLKLPCWPCYRDGFEEPNASDE
jgi:hypothetical protein